MDLKLFFKIDHFGLIHFGLVRPFNLTFFQLKTNVPDVTQCCVQDIAIRLVRTVFDSIFKIRSFELILGFFFKFDLKQTPLDTM